MTTQTSNPLRTVVRTAVQLIPGLVLFGAAGPEIAAIVVEQGQAMAIDTSTPETIVAGVGAASLAVSVLLTRLMAVPAVEQFLQSSAFTSWLAAEPPAGKHTDVDGDGLAG